jgi:hypothetical protein
MAVGVGPGVASPGGVLVGVASPVVAVGSAAAERSAVAVKSVSANSVGPGWQARKRLTPNRINRTRIRMSMGKRALLAGRSVEVSLAICWSSD